MRFLRDPLVAFLAAGAVLLLASRWWSGSDTSERIVVSDGVRARLSDQWQMQMRRLPTAEELAGLVDAFIREEIYYREAMRMGLDADDTIVRRRLVQKLTFLTEDIATAAQPDDAALLAWYDAHPDACSRPPRMSFEHRYFSVDRRENAQEDAAALADATQAGDPFMLQRSYAQRAEREIGDLFGRTFAAELFTLEPGDWQGPIRSAYGWHLVRISEKLPAARIPFAECRDRVLADLQMQARKEANDAYYQELLSRYTVVAGALTMSRPNAFVFLLLALVASAATSSALAHEVRPAYLQLTETAKDSWAILWKQPILQDMQLPIAPDFGPDCELLADGLSENTGSALLTRWTTNCALDKATITINGLTATLTDVMVRLDHANGDTSSFLLRPDNPSVDLSEQGLPLLGYLRLGIEHLLFGIDHVLFVVGLVLFIPGRMDLLKTITAFTLAHSLTLALSVLELVKVPQAPVEAIIALSILFLARELVVPVERRSMLTRARPWIMAFLFGLLHGLGFAGVLAEIGLPSGQFAASLLLFNVGIEIGQLLVILPMLILITVVHRLTASERAFTTYAWVMGSVAGMWTLDRIIGVFS